MKFWERTWRERSQELGRHFGPTDPPNRVLALSFGRTTIPGACVLVFPPMETPLRESPLMHRRPHYLYLSQGLTQPIDMKQHRGEMAAGKKFSSVGFELGFLTEKKVEWAAPAIEILIENIMRNHVEIKWGDRFLFGFQQLATGQFSPFTGDVLKLGITRAGTTHAILFWPYLMPDADFITSTGRGYVFIATGLTEDEYALTKSTSTPQMLLLLCELGIAQITDPNRESILEHPRFNEVWGKINAMKPQEADDEIHKGIGKWYAGDSDGKP